jgi:hypothetical protein
MGDWRNSGPISHRVESHRILSVSIGEGYGTTERATSDERSNDRTIERPNGRTTERSADRSVGVRGVGGLVAAGIEHGGDPSADVVAQ